MSTFDSTLTSSKTAMLLLCLMGKRKLFYDELFVPYSFVCFYTTVKEILETFLLLTKQAAEMIKLKIHFTLYVRSICNEQLHWSAAHFEQNVL